MAHDTDPFARWEAANSLALDTLVEMAAGGEADPALTYAYGGVLADSAMDPAFLALMLRLPAEDEVATEIARRGGTPDPDAIHRTREALMEELAAQHARVLDQIMAEMDCPYDYAPDAEQSGARSARLAALAWLSRLDGGERAAEVWAKARNMTERMGALTQLVRAGRAEAALAGMEAQLGANRLVMDKFFTVQPMAADPAQAVGIAHNLAARADFDWQNPNRFRALIGGLGANHAAFHAADGSGYDFVADWLIRMDAVNPQTAARMTSLFETWPRYDAGRRARARAALERIAARPGLSRNTAEMVTRILAAGG